MPATSDIHTEEVHRKDGSKKEDDTHMMAAAEKKNFGVFCDERGYLDQIEYIMQHGRRKGDRTGTGVISVFGAQARYSLRGLLASVLFGISSISCECLEYWKQTVVEKVFTSVKVTP